jgi:zinc protease
MSSLSVVVALAGVLACDRGGTSTAPDGAGDPETGSRIDAEREQKARDAAAKLARLEQLPPLPGITAPRPVQFPEPTSITLENGLEVLVLEDHEAPLVDASIYVKAGEIYAPAGKPLAGMVGALLSEGTRTHKKADIDAKIDDTGGSMSSSSSDETASVHASMMAKDLGLALSLMADEVQHPAFPDDSIVKVKEQSIQGIKALKGQPTQLVQILGRRVVYGAESAYGRLPPTEPEIQGVTRDELVAFHERHFRPNNAILLVAGDVDPAKVAKLARKHFGAWKAGEPIPVPTKEVVAPSGPAVHIISRRASAQATMGVVLPAAKIGQADWLETRVITDLLAGGTLSTRLNFVLREQLGLTYGAGAFHDYGYDGGVFWAGGGTKNKTADEFAAALIGLVFEMGEKAPEPAELTRVKAFVSGQFALEAEGVGSAAGKALIQRLYGLPADFWTRYRSDVEAIAAEQIAGAGARLFDRNKLQIVAIGKRSSLEEQLASYGKIHVYDTDLQPID